MISKLWNSARTKVGRLGWLDGGLLLLARFFQITTGNRVRLVRYYLVAQPVPEVAPAALARTGSNNHAGLVGPDAAIVAQFPRPAEIIAKRFRDQQLCFTTQVGDRFAGYLWLALPGYEEDEVRCRYLFADPDQSAWDFDVYVAPEFRIGRAFTRLWNAANQHMHSRGIRWTFSRISAFSGRSLASHTRMGARKLFSATFLCVGPVQLSVLGASPYLHLSLSRTSRPTLKLAAPDHA